MDITTPSKFTGWTELDHKHATLQAIVVDDQLQDEVSTGQAQLIFDETPFMPKWAVRSLITGLLKLRMAPCWPK